MQILATDLEAPKSHEANEQATEQEFSVIVIMNSSFSICPMLYSLIQFEI